MKYIVMELNADTLGTKEVHYVEIPDEVDEATIDDVYREMILDHAQSYGYEYTVWAEENIDDYNPDEDEDGEYWDDYEYTVMEFGYWDYLPAKPKEDEMGDSLYGLETWATF